MRHIVCVDTETTGLNPAAHVPIEIAWWDLATDERGRFVPYHSPLDIRDAGDEALEINGYFRRGLDREPQDSDYVETERLHTVLTGNTFTGSNPAFDSAMLFDLFCDAALDPEPWHHRIWDLSAYAAGVLSLDELPGLASACELLGVAPPDHTAEGDVTVTGLCLKALFAKAGVPR